MSDNSNFTNHVVLLDNIFNKKNIDDINYFLQQRSDNSNFLQKELEKYFYEIAEDLNISLEELINLRLLSLNEYISSNDILNDDNNKNENFIGYLIINGNEEQISSDINFESVNSFYGFLQEKYINELIIVEKITQGKNIFYPFNVCLDINQPVSIYFSENEKELEKYLLSSNQSLSNINIEKFDFEKAKLKYLESLNTTKANDELFYNFLQSNNNDINSIELICKIIMKDANSINAFYSNHSDHLSDDQNSFYKKFIIKLINKIKNFFINGGDSRILETFVQKSIEIKINSTSFNQKGK